jgi:hypothetical protein
MDAPKRTWAARDRKLLLQSIALLAIVVIPVFLFLAAQAGTVGSVLVLLVVMAGVMALVMIIS